MKAFNRPWPPPPLGPLGPEGDGSEGDAEEPKTSPTKVSAKRAGQNDPPFLRLHTPDRLDYLNWAFMYSLFSLAMNLTLIPFGQTAWHS